MIRSMTGFGEAAVDTPAGRLRAEIRTVNHRYFSTNLRLARGLERFEPQIREWLRGLLPRGHIHYSLSLERDGLPASGVGLLVDEERARQYAAALRKLKDLLQLGGDVDLAMLTRFGDLLVWEEDADRDVQPDIVRAVTEDAAGATIRMRDEEGRRLAVDLENRLASIDASLVEIEARSPARLLIERDRMRRVVSELLEGLSFDEERIAREIALIAERWDVSEEIVRLRSHIDLFRDTVRADGAEPIGKRLGFLVQEMNREANTIGSKANDAPIEHRVISIKEDIERLREQVENVE
jgi:uncharacterized protein (TIGR00255 family)